MRTLSDAEILGIWERGYRRDPIARALALLAAVRPDLDAEALAGVSVAERDAAILRLRQRNFGAPMSAYVHCPSCGERLEFEFDSARVNGDASDTGAADGGAAREVEIAGGLRFRLPSSAELQAAAEANDADGGARLLAQRCCLNAAPDLEWSDALVHAAERGLGELAEAADVQLGLACVECGHAWTAALDVAAYLWEEIEDRAARVLDDVHCLASRYGWSEAEIIALGEARRRAYLERCVPEVPR